jgi:predicted nuclease of restriction endonuclease-like RecB superfamily
MAEQKLSDTNVILSDEDQKTRQQLIETMMQILVAYGASTKEVNEQLRVLSADPNAKIGQGLIDIIKALCDCTAVHIILECLCKKL